MAIGLLLMLPLFFINREGEPEYPELERAVRVVKHLSSQRQLKRSSFLVYFPEGKPTDFVEWMFSGMGKAEWPPIEGGLEPDLEEGAKSIGTPIAPKNVGLSPNTPNKEAQMQVVVTADDSQGLIQVTGYLDPSQQPVLTREWPLPTPSQTN